MSNTRWYYARAISLKIIVQKLSPYKVKRVVPSNDVINTVKSTKEKLIAILDLEKLFCIVASKLLIDHFN